MQVDVGQEWPDAPPLGAPFCLVLSRRSQDAGSQLPVQ